MKNNVMKVNKNICTGCGACRNRCKINAIEMRKDKNGFLKPYVLEEKCIDCGKCLKICPAENPVYENNTSPECYALWAPDDIRKVSSSGGAFSVFAEEVLESEGIVFGAALQEDSVHVEHKYIHKKEDLKILRGSKYVQSDIKEAYRKTEYFLKQGRKVLFTGCPCQIAGLNAYLERTYDNLLTIDLICHGVPSTKILEKYINEKEKQYGKIEDICFRTKDLDGGWKRSVTVKLKTENKEFYEERANSDYLNAFLKTISISEVCGKCKFARVPRQGDVTIGDFWGVSKFNSKLSDDLGTSVVLINNSKGKSFLDRVTKNIQLLQKVPIEVAIEGNKQITVSPWVNSRGKRFYEIIDKYNLSKAIDYAANRRFDIGYVGWWYGANYGSVLTNFALHEVLTKELGKTVLMISYPNSNFSAAKNKSSRFAHKHYEIAISRKIEEYPTLNRHCEKFVLGSDQLWNWYSTRAVGHHFLLDWVEKNKIKIAYSTSFGHSRAFYPQDEILEISRLFQEFNSISVREEDGVRILKENFGVYADQEIDPVFLCPKRRYDDISNEIEPFKEEYVFAYILNPTEEKRKMIYYVAKMLNKKVIILIDGQANNKKELAEILGKDNVLLEVEIEQWIRLVRDSVFVVTDSFHGMCFSIIYHKNFVAFKNKKRGISRFQTISKILGLEHRILDEVEEIYNQENTFLLTQDVDYKTVDNKLNKERERSMNWLVEALNKPREKDKYNVMIYNLIKNQESRIARLEKLIKSEEK